MAWQTIVRWVEKNLFTWVFYFWPTAKLYALASGAIHGNYGQLARELADLPGGRILDIGSGPGTLMIELKRSKPSAQAFGADPSEAMVRGAREKARREGVDVRFELGSAERLPFPEGSFDLVVSTGSWHHFNDPVRALDETHRVLGKEGMLLVYDVYVAWSTGELEALAKKSRFGGCRISRYNNFLFRWELRK